MTTFFGGPGFGGAQTATREAKALQAIDSRTKTFTNKDFVKNMAWLNNSVDTLSAYTQKLQAGVDSANQNAVEQIQGLIADLIVIFAGGQPTGINLGDLQYIFQALGALLGVNPDTVFPLNLAEAARNLLTQFIVPLPQFTDVIFDAMMAWMIELGFSDEAVAAVAEFNDAIVDCYGGWNDVGNNIIPMLNDLLKRLGFGSGWLSLDFLRSFVKDLQAQLREILAGPRQLLFDLLNTLIVTLFKSLTWVVNMINPRNIMASLGVQNIGPQLAIPISDVTEVWQVGSNPNTQWVWDSVEIAPGSIGSFRTIGNAYGKRILTQGTEACVEGDVFAFSGWLKWEGVPTHQNQFGPCIVWMRGLNEDSQTNIDAPSERGEDGGWVQVGQNVVVPIDIDGFKIGYRCGAQIGEGVVWAGELSCTQISTSIDIFGTIVNMIWGCILTVFEQIRQIFLGGVAQLALIPEALRQGFNTVFTEFSNWMANIGVNLPAAIEQAAQAIWYFAELLYNTGTSSIAALAKFITDLWTTIQQIAQIFSGSIIADPLNNLVQQFNTWWENVGAGLPALPDAIADVRDGLQGILTGAGITVYETMQQAGELLGGAITSAQDAVWSIISGAGVNINQTLEAASGMLGDAINTAQIFSQGMVDALNNAVQGVSQGIGAGIASAQANFSAMVNAIPIFLMGNPRGSNYSQEQANAALEAQRLANEAKARQIVQIQDEFANVFNVNPVGEGNVYATFDFSQMADQSNMSGIMLPDGGGPLSCMGITNGSLHWQGLPGEDFQLFPLPTSSDYQVMIVTLGSLNGLMNNVAGVDPPWVDFVLRSNTSRTVYTALRMVGVQSGQACPVYLVAVNNGVTTTLASSANLASTLAAGGTFRIFAGDPGSESIWAYQVLYNGTPIITYNDAAHVSQAGIANRYLGKRMRVYFGDIITEPHEPELFTYNASGYWTVPEWVTAWDAVAVGTGAAGAPGGAGFQNGNGGSAGGWAAGTFLKSNIPAGTQLTCAVGGWTNTNGSSSVLAILGVSNLVVAPLGYYGVIGGMIGAGSGNFNYNGRQYAGSGNVGSGVNGIRPGGGGGGGTGGALWAANNPGLGAPGQINIYAYQYNGTVAPPDVKVVSYQDNSPPPPAYPYDGLPEPGVKGRVYIPSDTGIMLRDNGVEWERFMGGQLGFFTEPPAEGWARQLGTSTLVKDLDSIKLTNPYAVFSFWSIPILPVPANFTLTVYFEWTMVPLNGINYAWGLRESSTGRMSIMQWGLATSIAGAGPFIRLANFINGAFNSSSTSSDTCWLEKFPNWWRVRDNGTNRIWGYSNNGVDWVTFYEANRTAWNPAVNEFVLAIENLGPNYGTIPNQPMTLRLRSLELKH